MIGQLVDVLQLLRGYGIHLGDLPAVLTRRYGDRPAVDGARALSYAQLEEEVARLASAYGELGVGLGEAVLVTCAEPLDALVHLLAVARAGAVAVPVAAGDDVEVVGRAATVRLEVHDRGAGPSSAGVPALSVDEVAAAAVRRVGPADRDPDEPVVALLTGARLVEVTSHGLLGAVGRLALAPVGRQAGVRAQRDLALTCVPLTDVVGLSVVLAALCAGVPLVLRPDASAREVLAEVEQRRPNVVVGQPATYAELEAAGAAEHDLASVQLWVSAGGVGDADRPRRFQQYGAAAKVGRRRLGTAAFVEFHGVAELGGPAAIRLLPPALIRPLPAPSVATTLPGIEVRAVDDEGRQLPWGQVGRIELRGPIARRPRWRTSRGNGTSGPGDGGGWVETGEVGRVWPGGLFSLGAGRSGRPATDP